MSSCPASFEMHDFENFHKYFHLRLPTTSLSHNSRVAITPVSFSKPTTGKPWLLHRPLPWMSPKCKFGVLARGSINKSSGRATPLVRSTSFRYPADIPTVYVALRPLSQLDVVRRSMCPDLYDIWPSKADLIHSPACRCV